MAFLHLCEKSHNRYRSQMHYLCFVMRILTVVLLLGVLLQTWSKQLIYTDYLVNKDFITKVLCINKDEPQKHCEGKCHLKKQLDQDSRKQGGNEQKSKTAQEVLFLCTQHDDFEMLHPLVTKHYFQHQLIASNVFLTPVFHPPGGYIV
jgi:hypothetical protein